MKLKNKSSKFAKSFDSARGTTKGILSACYTRWNSVQKMFHSILGCRTALEISLGDGYSDHMFDDDEWILMEIIRDLLMVLAPELDILQGENYPTINLVIPRLCAMRSHWIELGEDTGWNGKYGVSYVETAKRAVDHLVGHLDTYFGDPIDFATQTHGIYLVATFLDPRFKDFYWLPLLQRAPVINYCSAAHA